MADFRSKVTYKRSVTIKLHSTVMLNPLHLKILSNFFFLISESGPAIFSRQFKLSSLYRPIFCLPNFLVRGSKRYKLTNSHNSTPL